MKIQKEKIIQWICFLGLSSISILFMKEVFQQFNSNDTSLKMSEIDIKHYPTITACFKHPNKSYEYGTEVVISYNENELNKTVKSGENEDVTVNLQEIYSYFDGSFCYKIKHGSDEDFKSNAVIDIRITFVNLTEQELPKVEIFVTSESNSDGVIFKERMDGSELRFVFEKVISEINFRAIHFRRTG